MPYSAPLLLVQIYPLYLLVSKGINGHSTGLGGVIVARKDVVADMRDTWGVGVRAVMDPMGAKRMLDGLTTLKERMLAHSANAFTLAQYLNTLSGIDSVRYPFLRVPSFDYQRQAKEQMEAGGPLFGFTLKGTLDDTRRFMNVLASSGAVIQAPHICHTKTLAIHPASTTHARVPEEDRAKLGITDTFIRVSAGTEHGVDFSSVWRAFEHAHDVVLTHNRK